MIRIVPPLATSAAMIPSLVGKNLALIRIVPVLIGIDPPLTGRDPPLTGRDPSLTGCDPSLTGRDPPLIGRDPPLTGRDPPSAGRDHSLIWVDPTPAATGSIFFCHSLLPDPEQAASQNKPCHYRFQPFPPVEEKGAPARQGGFPGNGFPWFIWHRLIFYRHSPPLMVRRKRQPADLSTRLRSNCYVAQL